MAMRTPPHHRLKRRARSSNRPPPQSQVLTDGLFLDPVDASELFHAIRLLQEAGKRLDTTLDRVEKRLGMKP